MGCLGFGGSPLKGSIGFLGSLPEGSGIGFRVQGFPLQRHIKELSIRRRAVDPSLGKGGLSK